jgi:glucose/arabinose dehydrogenase
MMRIPATTSLCILICLAACSDDPKGMDGGGAPGIDSGGGVGGDSGGGAQGGNDGGGGAAAGGGDGGGGDDGGAAGGNAGGNTDGGAAGGGGDGGQQVSCGSAPTVGQLKLEAVVSGVSRLVYAAQPPGSSDWWLVQQSGQIRILPAGATAPSATALLDVTTGPDAAGGISFARAEDERGLLGLAFAPDFNTSGLFYVMLTTTSGGQANRDQVRQYKKEGSTATYQATLVTLPASESNHNGGNIVIGPDNMLYVGTGDGGGSCNSSKPGTPQLISASEDALFGKILRLDPSKAPGYAATGNPFPDSPLVWHYGLRNPFRFGFDRSTGDLYIGDVGQGAYEDVEFAKSGVSGLNFGWAAYEGNAMTCGGRTLRAGSMETDPIFAADRRQRGCSGPFCDWVSVIGGVVYRGPALPHLRGMYIFGDYQGARMAALRQCDTTTSPVTVLRKECDPALPQEACFTGTEFTLLTAIVEDNSGELYLVTGVTDADGGKLLKVVAGP